ncbi:hypothetical protein NW768_002029 [Fusarium equiseti]|uniref:Uncharacterized protein n=1 Tax=Fusarium equiseti TaxID=61235 RepID=A0ABQ8RMM3_FUSEQ|nr:hypothetical protein NW768_002029 [Fusarium equiseti]
MPETTTPQAPAGFGENKGIKFSFKTGNARYHERTKATRQNSSDSVSSTDSTKTEKSAH